MQKTVFNRYESKAFSKFSNDFLYRPEIFSDLIGNISQKEAFGKQIKLKENFSAEKRSVLATQLEKQYASVENKELALQHVALLREENTFTVTTGHQLNLFTGPVFFIYKILHTIRLSEELKKLYPDFNFVPVYWMASEDHDFEEINHTQLFNRKIQWETAQNGPVGEFETENWDSVLGEVTQFYANHPEAQVHDLLQKYRGKNLSEATFRLVHELFKDYGLVILDAHAAALKQEFVPLMLREVETQFAEKAVLAANEKLETLGYKPQIFARPINLFYIGKGFRERIVFENDRFTTEQLGSLTLEEIKAKIGASPEQFSPNVVLRPLYQETILPNLAYIGGGAEIAYWTQLKGIFDQTQTPFPILQVRNSFQLIDKNSQKKLAKIGWKSEDLFDDLNTLKNRYVQENSSEALDFSKLEAKANELQQALTELVVSFDPNLKNLAEAENTKIAKQIEYIQAKMQKQQKVQFDGELKIVEDLKNKLFPNNALQERHDNFLSFCPDGNYTALIRELYENADPWEKDLIVLEL